MADAVVEQFTEVFYDDADYTLLRASAFLRERRYSTGTVEWRYSAPRVDMDARQLRADYPRCIAFWTTYRPAGANADYCHFGVRRGYYVVSHDPAVAAAPKLLAYLWERQSPAAAFMGARTPQHETWVAEAPFVVPPPFVDPYYPRTPEGSSSDGEDAN